MLAFFGQDPAEELDDVAPQRRSHLGTNRRGPNQSRHAGGNSRDCALDLGPRWRPRLDRHARGGGMIRTPGEVQSATQHRSATCGEWPSAGDRRLRTGTTGRGDHLARRRRRREPVPRQRRSALDLSGTGETGGCSPWPKQPTVQVPLLGQAAGEPRSGGEVLPERRRGLRAAHSGGPAPRTVRWWRLIAGSPSSVVDHGDAGVQVRPSWRPPQPS